MDIYHFSNLFAPRVFLHHTSLSRPVQVFTRKWFYAADVLGNEVQPRASAEPIRLTAALLSHPAMDPRRHNLTASASGGVPGPENFCACRSCRRYYDKCVRQGRIADLRFLSPPGSHAPRRARAMASNSAPATAPEPSATTAAAEPRDGDVDADMEAEPSIEDPAAGDAMAVDDKQPEGAAAAGATGSGTAEQAAVAEARIPQKKDETLRELLGKMDDYTPIVRPCPRPPMEPPS